MRKLKVDLFIETGTATCVHHGDHSNWKLLLTKQKKKKGKTQTYRVINCMYCSAERTKRYRVNNPTWSDDYRFSFHGILNRIINQASTRSRKKSIPMEVDALWLKEKLKEQDYTCAYSGVKFDFSNPAQKDRTRLFLPSLDQKIPGIGYTKENTVVVAVVVNVMKNELNFDHFVSICRKIADNNK